MAKKLEETEAVSSIAMKKLSEKQKIYSRASIAYKIKKKRRVALKDEMLRIRRKS